MMARRTGLDRATAPSAEPRSPAASPTPETAAGLPLPVGLVTRLRSRPVRLVRALALHLGLLWLGWGDLGGLVGNPARLGFVAVFGAGLVFETTRVQQTAVRRQSAAEQHRLFGLYLIWLALLWFLPFADRHDLLTLPAVDAIRFAGLALVAAGLGFRAIAVVTLGRQFSTAVGLQAEHALVQRGIYGWIRHPAYLGMLLTFGGAPLVFRSLPGLAFVVLVFLVVRSRIAAEEALLEAEFGERFRCYARRTSRLVPGVW